MVVGDPVTLSCIIPASYPPAEVSMMRETDGGEMEIIENSIGYQVPEITNTSGRPGSKFCPGRDRAGMTLIPAGTGTGTGIEMKSRPGPGLVSSRPGPGFFH